MSLHSFKMPVCEQAQVLPLLQTDLLEVVSVHPDRMDAISTIVLDTADCVPNLTMDRDQLLQELATQSDEDESEPGPLPLGPQMPRLPRAYAEGLVYSSFKLCVPGSHNHFPEPDAAWGSSHVSGSAGSSRRGPSRSLAPGTTSSLQICLLHFQPTRS
mmetsp:Transcript_8948/g.19055  ORF Transcript_8948/g.19055 Transcript_8948/m.19055 type:complete len:158 (+) Transcript_8948:1089-1562(+)